VQNKQEALIAWQQDRAEKDAVIFNQIEERAALQRDIKRPDPERDRIEQHRRARQRTRRPSGL